MGKRKTYMDLVDEATFELKIYVTIKAYTECDKETEEYIENGKKETEFTYAVEAFNGEGDLEDTGSGQTIEEAIASLEGNW